MENSNLNNESFTTTNNVVVKPSNTISWLGFSFALFTLFLLWFTFLTIFLIGKSDHNSSYGIASILLMIFLFIGLPVGLLGLILSVVGLNKAAKTGGKRWIGVVGLIFSGLSVLSLFAPFIFSFASAKEPAKVVTPASVINENRQENNVVFVVEGYQLKCYDNRETNDVKPYQTRLEYSSQIKKELEVWFKMHNVPKEETIILKVSSDTNYSQVAELLEALKRLGRTKYQLTSAL